MSDNADAASATREALLSNLQELMLHLEASNKRAADQTLLALLLQCLTGCDGPDSPEMDLLGPVLNTLKKRLHGGDFEGALHQANLFREKLDALSASQGNG